jgi:DNA anti-recombination protein RmuC|tara:strand:+ start:4843 stop:5331 length:489 start_codon:yes stop_codon:yes gene_type:complete
MAEVEIAGAKIKGGKLLLVLPVLGTLAGGLWAGFEFYKDYMDMKEVIANIDVDAIKAENKVLETKLDDAITYTRDIKGDLKAEIMRTEAIVESIEKRVKSIQDSTRQMIDKENDRNDKIRERIQNRMDSMDDTLTKKMKDLNNDVNDKIKKALNNPLSSMRK